MLLVTRAATAAASCDVLAVAEASCDVLLDISVLKLSIGLYACLRSIDQADAPLHNSRHAVRLLYAEDCRILPVYLCGCCMP